LRFALGGQLASIRVSTRERENSMMTRTNRMKCWLVNGVLALSIIPVAQVSAAELQRPVWHTDYPAAKAAARQSGKPLFVVFRCQP
jgi:hypothetical protein